MTKRIYVGNLDYNVSSAELEQLFAPFGAINTASVVTDRMTGQSKGFGFVEMSNDAEAQAAIAALNGKDMGARALTVSEARPRAAGGGGTRRW